LAPKKGVLIRNYPKVSLTGSESRVESGENKTLTFVYAGGLSRIRGIKEICQAIGEIKEVKLILLGVWESEEYKDECLKDLKNVEFLGAKPIREVYPIIRNSDVGFVNFYHEKNHLNCLPTKSFEYMTCGLPMIISDIPYWSERYAEFSIFVEPTNIESIKKAILWMIDNKDERIEMGLAGQKAVKELYSWESESLTLIKMYNELVKK
jgi:glycosyltransferase involved in cell wall biosynthesis